MANLIEVAPQNRTPDEILHPDSRALFRYWETIRGERSAPLRGDIDLKQIKQLLPWLAILERHPLKPEYTWRLAGTGVCKIWNKELTAQMFLADADAFERDAVCRLMDNVIASHQPCVARYRAVYHDHELLGVEMLALPVTAANDRSTQIIAAVVPFRSPYWLGESELNRLELSSVKMIWTEHSEQDRHPVPQTQSNSTDSAGKTLFRVIEGGLNN